MNGLLVQMTLLATCSMAMQGQTVAELIVKAKQERNPVESANYLMQADAAAEKLERHVPGGCCGNRCLRVGGFELHYRFNELDRQEDYQHDLLQSIVSSWQGTPQGADALARLLPTGCQTIASRWTPYFRTILEILELKRWQDLGDWRLTRIRGEAYETWWSLSLMPPNDSLVTDEMMNPADFKEGAELARQRAIFAYQTLLKQHHADADIVTRLRALVARRDTGQHIYVCAAD
jgi:hypothetical protein